MLDDDAEKMPVPCDYYRFQVAWYFGNKKRPLGVLRSVRYVLEDRDMTREDERALRDAVWWFNWNLSAPRNLRRIAAIFWFKPDVAGGARMWSKSLELARLLQKYKYQVEVVSTRRPGKIVYHDSAQIAAIPFKETFEVSSIATYHEAR